MCLLILVSSRSADHSSMFLNGLFLGVLVPEEAVPALRIVEERDGLQRHRWL